MNYTRLIALSVLALCPALYLFGEEMPASTADKASYGIGQNIGQSLQQQGIPDLNAAMLAQGLEDAIEGNEARFSGEEIAAAFAEMQERQQTAQAEAAKANTAEAEAFLEENAARPEVNVTDSGLQYEVLVEGSGPKPGASDTVVTHYRGTLINGEEFDSSFRRNQPAEFPVNRVIPGWTEALQLMPVGSKWKLYIPAELAYGANSPSPAIPPNSALIFELELLDIK